MTIDGDRTTPYGHELDPDLHQELRGEVSPEALAWVEQAVGAPVVAQRALEGGMSSAVHLLTTGAGPGLEQVVLRRYVLDWVVIEEPHIPGNEALALRLVGDTSPTSAKGAGIPAPRLIASDPDGSQLGVPATLMTALPGSLVWDPPERTPWLRALAELAVRIHALPAPSDLADWAPYEPYARTPPSWSKHPDAWLTAYELWDGPPPPSERVLVHRDFHPGNVLWTDGVITGVIDWVSTCAGPPEEDIGHCRVNLAMHHGQDCADEFLAIWQELTGKRDYHPYWDLTNVVSFDHSQVEPRLDAFVAAAAARL